MSYSIIKGVSQMKVDAKEIDNQIYLPLDAFWDNYTILEGNRVIFLDSPIDGLRVGILNLNPNISDAGRDLNELLTGAGCKVKILNDSSSIPDDLNLILELNPDEGIYHVGYGGYCLNGSRRLARDISWAMAKVFELDFIAAPEKEKKIMVSPSFWSKLTVPIISIKWREKNESNLLLSVAILLGLFRFASSKLPLIDDKIFLLDSTPQKIMDEKKNDLKKQGRLVSDPSPKLQAYMKKILAEQNAKAEKLEKGYPKNIATMDACKKSGLGNG